MLNQIQQIVAQVQNSRISFPRYFVQYMLDVQDKNLSLELRHLRDDSNLTLSSLAHVIDDDVKRGDVVSEFK